MTRPTKPDIPSPDGAKPGAGEDSDSAAARAKLAKAELVKTVHAASRATAVAAGVFMALVAAMLVANHVRGKRYDPLEPPAEYAAAKRAVLERTADAAAEKLKDDLRLRIRELDRRIRAEAFRRDEFRRIGGWLLFAGVVVLVAAIQVATALAKTPPHPEGEARGAEAALLTASRVRWAIAVAGVVLAAGAVVLATMPLHRASAPAVTSPRDSGKANGPASPEGGGGKSPGVVMTDDYPSPEEFARNWPRFRGPRGDGVSAHANIPVSWDEKTGENILWRTPLDLDGAASPVIWGARVFATGGNAKRRVVYCLDAASGKLAWTAELKDVPGSPEETAEVFDESGYAAPTPVTDGRRVYAMFANGDIGAFDYEGKTVWARAMGFPDNDYGFAQSLAMWRGLVIIQFDQTGKEGPPSALHALDAATGKTVWETEREMDKSWASPIVVAMKSGDVIVTSANPFVIAYDPATGGELWRAEVLDGELAPSPILAGGLVIAVMEGPGMTAIRPGGRGNVTKSHALWVNENGDFPDASSPVSDGERVYTVTFGGMVTCVSMKDGSTLWEHNLKADTYVSPSLVGDRVYVLGEKGEAFIFAAAGEYRALGKGKLESKVAASPAFADGRMYVRGDKALYCIGKK